MEAAVRQRKAGQRADFQAMGAGELWGRAFEHDDHATLDTVFSLGRGAAATPKGVWDKEYCRQVVQTVDRALPGAVRKAVAARMEENPALAGGEGKSECPRHLT